MLAGLLDTDGAKEALPFVRLFYGEVSEYLWTDDEEVTHTVRQGEGGEQAVRAVRGGGVKHAPGVGHRTEQG